jgi:hypothetical protein
MQRCDDRYQYIADRYLISWVLKRCKRIILPDYNGAGSAPFSRGVSSVTVRVGWSTRDLVAVCCTIPAF